MSTEKTLPDDERRAISLELEVWVQEAGSQGAVAKVLDMSQEAVGKALPHRAGQVGAQLSRRVQEHRGPLEVLKRRHGIGLATSEEERIALAVHLLELRGTPVTDGTVADYRATSWSGGPRSTEAIADELLAAERRRPSSIVPKPGRLARAVMREQRKRAR
jgi:hypothetical protein